MDSIKNLLNDFKQRSPLMKSIKASLAVEHLQKLIEQEWGNAVKDQVKVISLKNQVISIACLNPALASEIRLRELRFINNLNNEFGHETVKKMKIMLK